MLELIRTAGIFMIIAQTMYHFVSGSKYARYVRLLIRIMTLAVLVIPLLDLIKSGAKEDFYERLAKFEQEYEAILQNNGYAETTFVEERVLQTTVQELKAAVDPVFAPYGYEIVSVYADESSLLFELRSFFAGGTGEIEVSPVSEIHIQIREAEGGTEDGGTERPDGRAETENGGMPGEKRMEDELADAAAAYLRVERSLVEVRILE